MDKTSVGLREWKIDSGKEPVVRIGVILREDAMGAVEMEGPASADYEVVDSAGKGGRAIKGKKLAAQAERGRGVSVAVGEERAARGESWWVKPKSARMAKRGEGLIVRGVVAGRGFHWQKHVDQTLGGAVEVLASPEGAIELVNEIGLEEYLAGVITSEMSSECPIEFLKAQCITARSWLLAFTEPKHRGEPFDRCNDDCCQRYQGTGDLSEVAIEAVSSTRGLVLVAREGGKVVDANYSKSCGGIVELPEHVWGVHKAGLGEQVDAPEGSEARKFLPVTEGNLREYLEGAWLAKTDVYCSSNVVKEETIGKYLGRVDETGKYFRWTVKYGHDELLEMLKGKIGAEAKEMRGLRDLKVSKRGISGRAIEILIGYEDSAGTSREIAVADQYRIRQLLHRSFLFSSAFAADVEKDASGRMKSVTLRGAGWGHGAGLCQIGALGMALCGVDHEKIVKHYFPGAELKRVY